LIRIGVLGEFVKPAWPTQPQYIDEVTRYLSHLTDLIQQVVTDVENSHVISQTFQWQGKPPGGYQRAYFVHSQLVRDYSAADPNAPSRQPGKQSRREPAVQQESVASNS
jgi:hypothetical protein